MSLLQAPAPVAASSNGRARRSRGAWLVHPLVPILVLAAVLRLWGLPTQPALYFDSGVYLGEGQFLASVAEGAASALFRPETGAPGNPVERVARALERGTAAHPPDIAKPGHALLLATSMLLFGQTVFAGALVSALAGIGTVALTYSIGALGWSRRVGLLAALLLAVSAQHLVYSREALVESDGAFFALMAAFFYLRSALRRGQRSIRALALVGAIFGLSFACNNRFSYWPATVIFVELALWRSAGWRGWPTVVRRGVALVAGFLAPLALVELAYLGARLVGRTYGLETSWLDYLQQLAAFTRMNAPDRLRWDEWPTYWVDLVLMDGPLVVALLLAGVVFALRRLSLPSLLLLASLLVPIALYSVYSTGEVRMRHFSLALPWAMLAASLGGLWLTDLAALHLRSRGRLLAPAVGALLVALALPRAAELASAPSGYPALLDSLRQAGATRVASTNGPVLGFLVGEANTNARLRAAFVNDRVDVLDLARQYPAFVAEMQAYVFPGRLTDVYDATPPVLEVPHGTPTWYLADLLDHHGMTWGRWTEILDLWRAHQASATRLRVFDSADVAAHT